MSTTAAIPNSSDTIGQFDYSNRTKKCDIVMKGGITSGVVYPLAVCELAQTYHMKNIGGTSAGAIAAAATAAAELGMTRKGRGFAKLEDLPKYLGELSPGSKQSNLFSLFQPQPETRPLFNVLTAALGQTGIWAIIKIFLSAIRNFPGPAILGVLPALLLALLTVLWADNPLLLLWSLICAVFLGLLGIVIAVGMVFFKRTVREVPKNFFGLCSGYQPDEERQPPPLVTWLADYLDDLAENHDPAKPLTFGDLWGDGSDHRDINLEMMTTNLTHGRPYRLPFDTDIFAFDPEEFRKLFPKKVVDWMVANPQETGDPQRYGHLWPLPEAADLPVVVAARMSLSFPMLISAIPLYAVDYTRESEKDQKFERCWFSDGGIASNFPVHFFDSPLPKWPTFGINLRSFHPDYPRQADETRNSWMPSSNYAGSAEWWNRFDQRTGSGSLTSFFGTILNTMQNWMDNAQFRVPGYRDRVVHVSLDDTEGGLNLNMPPDLIERLGLRGRFAADKLITRYTMPQPDGKISWQNHRWVRYRSTMSLLDSMLNQIKSGYNHSSDTAAYADLFIHPPSYEFTGVIAKNAQMSRQDFAHQATVDLLTLIDKWDKLGFTFSEDAPRPTPELRISPRI